MRHLFVISIAAALIAPISAVAQQQPKPAAPKAAPPKPYTAVPVKLPEPLADASFEAFRKQVGEAAAKKDRAALGKLVVTQGFFWEAEDGDKADKKKSSIDNLAAILKLADKDTQGWDMLAGFASDPTAMQLPQKQGVVCGPADPVFDEKALEELAKSTQTDPGDWAFIVANDTEVRATAKPGAPVSEKLGLHFVRILPEAPVQVAANQPPMVKIVTPSGKTGFVSADMVAPLGNDQVCYRKDGNDWKIAGFNGSGM